ncbi:MAG: hypothetical protein WCR04_01390 [Fibrobacteraceae bacterium]
MKKVCLFLLFAVLPPLALVSCLFDSSGDSLVSWLDDQGFPSNYAVQTVDIDSIYLSSYEVGFDSTPRKQLYQGVLGTVSGMKHDLVFDFCFRDKSFFAKFDADSAKDFRAAFLALYPDSGFYAQAGLGDSLPIEEALTVKVSWALDTGAGSAYLDSVGDIKDSVWLAGLRQLKYAATVDTVMKINITDLDSALRLDLPDTLVQALSKVRDAAHLQLRLSAPDSKRLYRFYGPSSDITPFMRVKAYTKTVVSNGDASTSDTYKNIWPFRMAIVSTNMETCSDCVVLHGGVLESLLVDIPTTRILSALENLYGDSFPYTEGDSMDVRQAVVLARLTMPRSSSTDGSELGFPVQVVAASFVDSNGKDVESGESYKLNKDYILEKGHPNIVFFGGDSLSLQITDGLRSYINRAATGAKLRVVLRLGYSMLAPYDTLYYDHAGDDDDDDDSVHIFMDYLTYSRFDFTHYIDKKMHLKLWLATKRGDDE